MIDIGVQGAGTDTLRPPDVVVWEADGRPLPGLGYGARVAEGLAAPDVSIAVVPYRERALTDAELAAPVHVLSGGETSAFSGDPVTVRSLAQLTGLLQRAWQGDVTLVGICLGAQLLARAIAPDLPRAAPDAGMEAGPCAVHGELGERIVAELHYEHIHPAFAEVPGVELTWTNAHSPVQGFRWHTTVLGYQFHPEWTAADLAVVLERYAGLIGRRHADPGAVLRSGAHRPAPAAGLVEEMVAGPVAAALTARQVTAA